MHINISGQAYNGMTVRVEIKKKALSEESKRRLKNAQQNQIRTRSALTRLERDYRNKKVTPSARRRAMK